MVEKWKIKKLTIKGAKLFLVFLFLFYSASPYGLVFAEGEQDSQAKDSPQSTEISSSDGANETTSGTTDGTADPETSSESSETQEVQQPSQSSEQVEGDPSAANSNTGADSTNSSETNVTNTTTVTNENEAITYNDAYLKSETGTNRASFNTGSGVITTEKAEGRGELINLINSNKVNVADTETGPVNAENENTGANSENEATVNITDETVVKNINNSNTINRLRADVISGRNDTSSNTGHGITLSGQASLGLSFMSLANTNFTGVNNLQADMQNVFGNHSGDVDFNAATPNGRKLSDILINVGNKNTGAGSTNTAIVNVNDETTITNINSGKLQNEITANIISGQNKANYNTGTGSIGAGDVKSSLNIMNFLNANITSSNFWLKSLNVFGNWSGNINLPKMPSPNLTITPYAESFSSSNSQTGSGSKNEAEIDADTEHTQENINKAEILNNFSVKTNTGNNLASFNNGSGIIKHGDAKSQVNTANLADINVTGDSWWVLIVNKFGRWMGTTVGSPSDMVVKANGEATVLSPRNSGIKVKNDSTGADSNNSSGANVNHSTEIVNNNNAEITNEVTVIAVSGENEAQYNLEHGYIDSGDIESVINAVNIANVNINVGNVLIGIVNVFGDWSGNVVFDNGGGASSFFDNIGGLGQNSASVLNSFNGNTGAGSQNNTSSSTVTDVNVENKNQSTTNNNSSATSSSGQNNADYNTGAGIIATGSSSLDSKITNQQNNNDVRVGTVDCGDANSLNQTTGAGSANNSATSSECNVDVQNDNISEDNNNVIVNNSTGSNSASYNTGNGVVDTSWVSTFVDLHNKNNDNKITIGQVQNILDNVEGENGAENDGAENSEDGEGGAGESDQGDGSQEDNSSNPQDNSRGDDSQEQDNQDSQDNQSQSGDPQESDTQENVNNNNRSTETGANTETNTNANTETNDSSNTTNTSENSGSGNNNTNNNKSSAGSTNSSSSSSPSSSSSASSSNAPASSSSSSPVASSSAPVATAKSQKCSVKGDINCDGKVDIFDLSIIMANWGKRFKDKKSDLSGDGKVDFYDLSIIMGNWTKTKVVNK